ncbi:uncharacterized protein [Macrobrachium rosenbergii]|uniref:uncharacterized protein n=1 Tax=Macrobrachium rosenbergii TaxID=79674 RepID=UPI0034D75075
MNIDAPIGTLLLAIALIDVVNANIILTTGAPEAISGGASLLSGAAAVGGALSLGALALKTAAGRGERAAASCLPFGSPELYFTVAANGDDLGCGRRFVCEVEAAMEDDLVGEELLIRGLFSRRPTAFDGTPAGVFAKAGALGATQGLEACARAFKPVPSAGRPSFWLSKRLRGSLNASKSLQVWLHQISIFWETASVSSLTKVQMISSLSPIDREDWVVWET